MIIIAPKKNRVSYGGKTFHVTPNGKHYPLGAKQNWFTKCMSDGLKGNLNTGEGLSETKLQANRDKFTSVRKACLLARGGTPKKAGRPPKA